VWRPGTHLTFSVLLMAELRTTRADDGGFWWPTKGGIGSLGVCDVLELLYKFPCPTCEGNCVLPTDQLAPCRKCKGKGIFSSASPVTRGSGVWW
jgi:hypothetical protein